MTIYNMSRTWYILCMVPIHLFSLASLMNPHYQPYQILFIYLFFIWCLEVMQPFFWHTLIQINMTFWQFVACPWDTDSWWARGDNAHGNWHLFEGSYLLGTHLLSGLQTQSLRQTPNTLCAFGYDNHDMRMGRKWHWMAFSGIEWHSVA